MKFLNIILLALVEGTILALAILFEPADANSIAYWQKISWLIILAAINIYILSPLFSVSSKNKESTLFGVLPGISIGVFTYSIFSAGLVLLSLKLTNSVFSSYHLPAQIVLFAFTGVLTVLSLMGAKAAEIPKIDENLMPIDKLLGAIDLAELEALKCASPYQQNIKLIKEKIKYSLPHLSKIKSTEDYQALCSLSLQLEHLVKTNSLDTENHLNQITKHIKLI